MNSRMRRILIFMAVVGLLPSQRAPATYTPKVEPVRESYGTFNIQPEYDLEKVLAGAKDVQVKITITTLGEVNIKLISCESDDPSIVINPLSNEPQPFHDEGVLKTEYIYSIDIKKEAEPRTYQMKLRLQYLDNQIIRRGFPFNVGVTSKGRLEVHETTPESLAVTTNETREFTLYVLNHFHDYTVNMRKIEIQSTPSGLIENKDISFDPPKSIGPDQLEKIDIELKAAGMSLDKLIYGFGQIPKLSFKLTYDDGNDRDISDFLYEIDLRVKPNTTVLLLLILFGALVGALLNIGLQYLQQAKIIASKHQVVFVMVSIAVGMIVCIAALVGNVELLAFQLRASSDNPIVIFIMSMAGAIGGPPLIYTVFRLPKPGAQTPPQDQQG